MHHEMKKEINHSLYAANYGLLFPTGVFIGQENIALHTNNGEANFI